MPPVIHQLSNKSPTPFSTHTHTHTHMHTHSDTHMQAVSRCDLAVNYLVLDMKVSVSTCLLSVVDNSRSSFRLLLLCLYISTRR